VSFHSSPRLFDAASSRSCDAFGISHPRARDRNRNTTMPTSAPYGVRFQIPGAISMVPPPGVSDPAQRLPLRSKNRPGKILSIDRVELLSDRISQRRNVDLLALPVGGAEDLLRPDLGHDRAGQ